MKGNKKGVRLAIGISFGALVIAVFSLIVSYCDYRASFREDVEIDVSIDDLGFLHVFALAISKSDQPDATRGGIAVADMALAEIARAASWGKFTIRNMSNKALSIYSIEYQEGDHPAFDAPSPFFEKIRYEADGSQVHTEGPVGLPIRLDAGETKLLYGLVPFTVPQPLRTRLYGAMVTNQPERSSLMAAITGPRFFQMLYEDPTNLLRDLRDRQAGDFDLVLWDYVVITRRMFAESPADDYRFIDAGNSAPDGVTFARTKDLFNRLLPSNAYEVLQNLSKYDQDFETYHIHFWTTSGNPHTTDLPAHTLPLTAQATELIRDIEARRNQ